MNRLFPWPLLILTFTALLTVGACGGGDDEGSGDEGTVAASQSATPSPGESTSEPTPAPAQSPTVGTSATSADGSGPTGDAIALRSDAFDEGEPIPVVFTCDGENVSPQLEWDFAPLNTESYALVLQDPDAPGQTFIHWIVVNIPAETKELTRDWSPETSSGVVFGRNDFGAAAYGGPCPPPPHDAHTYEFRLFALNGVLNFESGETLADLEAAMAGHILAEALLTGTFDR